MTAASRPSVGLRLLFAAASALAFAAVPAQSQTQKPTLDDVRKHDQELEAIRAEQKKALDSQKKLQDEIAGRAACSSSSPPKPRSASRSTAAAP
jgi:septal ring factor EnvC (AmiA/AmiB activator)